MLAGENINTAVAKLQSKDLIKLVVVVVKRGRQAIGDLVPQAGAGRKTTKRKAQFHS